MNTAVTFREPAYAILSAVLAVLTLMSGMLTVFFMFAGIRGALNQAVPHGTARVNAIVICFLVAVAFAFVGILCGRLTYKCMRAASRE